MRRCRRPVRLALVGVAALGAAALAADFIWFRGSGFPPPHLAGTPTATSPTARMPGTVAVIVNGAIDARRNHPRYWNNTSLLYVALDEAGWERIVVLQSDGLSEAPDRVTRSFLGLVGLGDPVNSDVDLNGDGRVDVTGPATRAALERTLGQIGRELPGAGRLLVVFTDHGQLRLARRGLYGVAMLWGGDELSGAEFDDMLGRTVPGSAWVAVLAGQCWSGLFAAEIERPRTMLMAIGYPAWMYSDQDYSLFLYHFCGALLGRDPASGAPIRLPGQSPGSSPGLRDAFRWAIRQYHTPEWPRLWWRGDPASMPSPF